MNSILPSIMQSIKPQYCELIAAGKKTIEVRKTRPKLKPPFKVYIYQSKTVYVSKNKDNEFLKPILDKRLGKVIGEYVCDEIFEYQYMNQGYNYWDYEITDADLNATCLSYEEFSKYGIGTTLYGWHISDLKIYDEPKELGDFSQLPKNYDKMDYYTLTHNTFRLRRPPQSWCYVEEIS